MLKTKYLFTFKNHKTFGNKKTDKRWNQRMSEPNLNVILDEEEGMNFPEADAKQAHAYRDAMRMLNLDIDRTVVDDKPHRVSNHIGKKNARGEYLMALETATKASRKFVAEDSEDLDNMKRFRMSRRSSLTTVSHESVVDGGIPEGPREFSIGDENDNSFDYISVPADSFFEQSGANRNQPEFPLRMMELMAVGGHIKQILPSLSNTPRSGRSGYTKTAIVPVKKTLPHVPHLGFHVAPTPSVQLSERTSVQLSGRSMHSAIPQAQTPVEKLTERSVRSVTLELSAGALHTPAGQTPVEQLTERSVHSATLELSARALHTPVEQTPVENLTERSMHNATPQVSCRLLHTPAEQLTERSHDRLTEMSIRSTPRAVNPVLKTIPANPSMLSKFAPVYVDPLSLCGVQRLPSVSISPPQVDVGTSVRTAEIAPPVFIDPPGLRVFVNQNKLLLATTLGFVIVGVVAEMLFVTALVPYAAASSGHLFQMIRICAYLPLALCVLIIIYRLFVTNPPLPSADHYVMDIVYPPGKHSSITMASDPPIQNLAPKPPMQKYAPVRNHALITPMQKHAAV